MNIGGLGLCTTMRNAHTVCIYVYLTPKITQTIARALGYLLELIDRALLQKTGRTLDTGLGVEW